MALSNAGNIAREIWQIIPEQFPFVHLDAFVIMPNHIHGIVNITQNRETGKRGNGNGENGNQH